MLYLIFSQKQFECTDCGYIEKVVPIKKRCIYCGNEYLEYTWFYPSGCSKCKRSFVD